MTKHHGFLDRGQPNEKKTLASGKAHKHNDRISGPNTGLKYAPRLSSCRNIVNPAPIGCPGALNASLSCPDF
jgi:hypothetical protein